MDARSEMYTITTDEQEQIQLFKNSLESSAANNVSPTSHDSSGPYAGGNKNCGSWDKDMNDASELKNLDPLANLKMNLGVGRETGLDLTGIPQAATMATRGMAETADIIKDSVDMVGQVASTVGQGLSDIAESIEIKEVEYEEPEYEEPEIQPGIGWSF